jgi:hypothetical protein
LWSRSVIREETAVDSLEEIARAEEAYKQGAPSLGKALDMLVQRWSTGARDEGTLVRLLFLLWYGAVEPPALTGISVDHVSPSFEPVFESAGGEASDSPLVLWTAGRMAKLFPWALGDEQKWRDVADRLLERATQLKPRISAEDFSDLGVAGDYFRHMLEHP